MPAITLGRTDLEGPSTVSAITTAGTTQGTATTLKMGFNVLTTAASQTGALLPSRAAAPIFASVPTATSAVVYPPTGGAINGGSANAGYTVAQGKAVWCFPHPNGLDFTVVGA